MKNEKSDLRSRFSQTVVKDALVSLLAEKAIKDVSVAELCRRAGINRGTFYHHFYDIYDVYESLEQEVYRQVYEKIETVRTDALSDSFFRDMMEIVAQNSTLVQLIASNIGENSLLKRISAYAREKYVKDFRERFPGAERAEIESLFTYIFHGSIGIIADWRKNDPACSPETVSKRICRFNQTLVSGFLG